MVIFKKLFLIIGFISSTSLFALDIEGYNITGFASTGLINSNNSRAYEATINDENNFYRNTSLGAALKKSVNEEFSVHTQMVTKFHENDFILVFDTGHVNYSPNNNRLIRVGKMRLPVWAYSEYKYIGMVNPWLEGPIEVYAVNPIESYFGMSWTEKFEFSGWHLDFEVMAGGGPLNISTGSGEVIGNMKNGVGANLVLSSTHWRWNLNYLQADVSAVAYINSTADLVTGNGLDEKVSFVVDFNLPHSKFISTGLKYENYGYLVLTEFVRVDSDVADIDNYNAYYITLGKSFIKEKWFAHYTHSRITENDSVTTTAIDGKQYTHSIGLTHNIDYNLNLKLQYSETTVEKGTGFFEYEATGDNDLSDDPKLKVYGVSFNYIF